MRPFTPSLRASLAAGLSIALAATASELGSQVTVRQSVQQTVALSASATPRPARVAAGKLDSASAIRRRPARLPRPYLGEVLQQRDSTVERWPERVADPIRVWVAPAAPHLAGWDGAFPAAVRDAFDEWEATGVPVRFAYVDDSARAEVRVHWVSRFKTDESGRTVWWSNTRSWITRASITLSMHASDGVVQDATSLRAVALHEVGHLLGLDHCADALNVMAPWVEVSGLSDADRATARELYTLQAGRVR
jgi:predicted Zn-dependent protease